MEQEINLDEIQQGVEQKLEVKNRFEKLSEKVILTAKERDEAAEKFKLEAENRTKAEKERDFYKDFSKVSSQYPKALEHQDKILERVNRGYSTQDATLAVLNEVGQLQPVTANTTPQNPAGGSASTALTDFGDKSPEEMSREEKRNSLMEMEKQGINLLKL